MLRLRTLPVVLFIATLVLFASTSYSAPLLLNDFNSIIIENETDPLSDEVFGLYHDDSILADSFTSSSYISVTTQGVGAVGLCAKGKFVVNGSFAGVISTNTQKDSDNGSYTAAILAEDNVIFDSITSTSNISAEGTGQVVFGLYAGNNFYVFNNIEGNISAKSTGLLNDSFAAAIAVNKAMSVGDITESSTISAFGKGAYVFGISAYQNLCIGSIEGTVKAIGTKNVFAIYSQAINIDSISGTVAVDADHDYSAAISTEIYDMDEAKWVSNANINDSLTLVTGANIQGDIRLGGNSTSIYDSYMLFGDVLELKGQGTFNYNMHGIDTLVLDQLTSDTSHPYWSLNFRSQYDQITRCNSFSRVLLRKGTLEHSQSFYAKQLVGYSDSSIVYNLKAAGSPTPTIYVDIAQLEKDFTIKPVFDDLIEDDKTYTLIDSNLGIGVYENITDDDVVDCFSSSACSNSSPEVDLAVGSVDDLIIQDDYELIDFELTTSPDGLKLLLTASLKISQGDKINLIPYSDETSSSAVRSYQNAINHSTDGDVGDVVQHFLKMKTADEITNDLRRFTPHPSAATAFSTPQSHLQFIRSLTTRTKSLSTKPILKPDPLILLTGPAFRDENGFETWATGFGYFSRQDDVDATPGYDATAIGSLLGVDKLSNDNMLTGYAIGFVRTEIDSNREGSTTEINAFAASTYFAYQRDQWKLEGGLVYTLGLSDFERKTAAARIAEAEDVLSHTFTPYISLSYDFTSSDGRFAFTPSAQIAYSYFTQESYEEEGASSLNLDVDSYNNDILTSTLSFAASYRVSESLVATGLIAWKSHLINDDVTVDANFLAPGATPFQTISAATDDNAIEVGLGFDWQISEQYKASADYVYQKSGNFESTNINLGFNVLF